jgi:hypothetical protein
MAFITIPTAWIQPGEPVKTELWTLTKDNLDDLDARVTTTETSTNQSQVIDYYMNGQLQFIGVKQGIFKTTLPANITLLSGRIRQYITSGSGTFEIDIKFKRGVNPFQSIFTTKPSVTVANGNDYSSINGVLAESVLLAGDEIQFDIVSVQNNSSEGSWMIGLEYEAT